jgi:hypothetical protein
VEFLTHTDTTASHCGGHLCLGEEPLGNNLQSVCRPRLSNTKEHCKEPCTEQRQQQQPTTITAATTNNNNNKQPTTANNKQQTTKTNNKQQQTTTNNNKKQQKTTNNKQQQTTNNNKQQQQKTTKNNNKQPQTTKNNQQQQQQQQQYKASFHTYLEPVNGTTIDQRRKLSQSCTECITNGTHGKNNMELIANTFNEEIE